MLTLDCTDHTVAIFDQLLEEFAGPLQFHFITLEGIPESRTVLVTITELQGRVPHVFKQSPAACIYSKTNSGRLVRSHPAAADARLPHAAHRGSLGGTAHRTQPGGQHRVRGDTPQNTGCLNPNSLFGFQPRLRRFMFLRATFSSLSSDRG